MQLIVDSSRLRAATAHIVRIASVAVLVFLLMAPSAADAKERMIVLGIDGMDPELLEERMEAGDMPNFVRLREMGGYSHLGTSIPPQSPVAWSNFITGLDPGGHGIFDFIHRDPTTLLPYSSTAKVEGEVDKSIKLGRYIFPLSAPSTVLLREGKAFWEILDEHDVPATMFRIPANYPPTEFSGKSLSGMGTPDLLGTPGTFSYFTNDPQWFGREMEGGAVFPVRVERNVVETSIRGPENSFLEVEEGESHPAVEAPLTVYVDPENQVARIEFGDHQEILKVGEWSDWMVADFEFVPFLVNTTGVIRLYLKETTPYFRMYATPIQLNPKEPAQPISTPPDYAEHICEETGFFYTQGMPEDTKALTGGVFDDADFFSQASMVLEERERLFDHVLSNWTGEGLLFFYFSSVDLQSHVMYHHTDPDHPAHEPDKALEFSTKLMDTYRAMDGALGRVMEVLDDETTLVVMSDHGFAPFRRAVNLNRWLADEGYLVLKDDAPSGDDTNIFLHVDWSQTRAYALGLNLLYINTQGRERKGMVPVRERKALAAEIGAKLETLIDPEHGERMVTRTYLREDIYHGPNVGKAPDLIVGYAAGYRASWQTALGQIPDVLVVDNAEKWSGDHCMDHTAVPGIVLSNRPIRHASPELTDLTATILETFGIPKGGMMRGTSIFKTESAAR